MKSMNDAKKAMEIAEHQAQLQQALAALPTAPKWAGSFEWITLSFTGKEEFGQMKFRIEKKVVESWMVEQMKRNNTIINQLGFLTPQQEQEASKYPHPPGSFGSFEK